MDDAIARRQLLKVIGACAIGGVGFGPLESPLARALPMDGLPVGPKTPRLLCGCSAFSFRKSLSSGRMTLEDFIGKAVDLRLDGVDVTLYYLKSTDQGYLESLRYLAYKNAVTFLGAACGSRMAQADPAKRAAAIDEIKNWVNVTAALGAPQLRLFAGPVPPGVSLAEATDWVVETMKAALDYSAKKGITLSLENNRGVSQIADTCLEIMRRVDSPYAGLTVDITHFVATPTQDAYAQIAACIPYATNVHVLDHFDDDTPLDMERVWKLFAQSGYRGYMSLEYDAKPGMEDKTGVEIPRLTSEIRSLCRKYSTSRYDHSFM